MTSSKKLFIFGVLPALFFQSLAAYFYFLSELPAPEVIYSASKIFIFAWPLFWLLSFKKNIPKWEKPSMLTRGLLFGLLFALPIWLFSFIFKESLIDFVPFIKEKVIAFNLLDPTRYIFFSIFLSLFHSLLEEYYWRWFIFRGLCLQMDWRKAAFFGSLAFAAHHYLILSQFFNLPLTFLFGTLVGVGGFLWCVLYKKTRSILAPWLSHAVVDGCLMTIGYRLLF